MPEGSFFSFAASLQYLADRVPSSCHERPASSSAPSRFRKICKRLTAEGSRGPRSVRENCHQKPSIRTMRPSFSIAFRSWLTTLTSEGSSLAVPYAGEAEEIAGELRAARMDDEGSVHSQGSTEKAGLED